ncbi:hypothetical protein ABMA28_004053 [Loxostege sticticalis]|uniref:Organic solute transporter alpha-like protein n=1 Tax=Loxostege sticticalis TaxID=481309 RepID=A0ABD0SU17_LOXSC
MTSTMDLLREGDAGTRILTARHISADNAVKGLNNGVNTSLLCHSYSVQPDFGSYLAALDKYALWLWTSGFLILLIICALYAITLRSVWRHSRDSITNVAVVLAVYPVVGAAAYITTVVPRSVLICEAIAQQAVMIGMYHFYCMIIADCGGVEKLVRQAGDCHLETRVLPCCCWPCCVIPRPRLQRHNVLRLRYLIVQMPIVQALIYIIILLIWAEDMMLYLRSFTYLQPFVAASILTGIWGVTMSVRAAEAAGLRPRPKFFALQLVLLIVKLQCGIIRFLPQAFSMPCMMSLNPAVFVNMLQNSMTLVEMLLLSVLAWRLYSSAPARAGKVQHAVIATVEDSIFDVKSIKDSLDSKSYKGKGEV